MITDNCKALVQGKLTAIRQFSTKEGPRFEHHITVPAPDEYSHPNIMCVISDHKLAALNELLTVKADIKGFRNSFVTKNGDPVIKVEHRLFADHAVVVQA